MLSIWISTVNLKRRRLRFMIKQTWESVSIFSTAALLDDDVLFFPFKRRLAQQRQSRSARN